MMAIKSGRQLSPADAPCSADQSGITSRLPEEAGLSDGDNRTPTWPLPRHASERSFAECPHPSRQL